MILSFSSHTLVVLIISPDSGKENTYLFSSFPKGLLLVLFLIIVIIGKSNKL